MSSKNCLDFYIKLTIEEANLMKQIIKDADETNYFRNSSESKILQDLKAKVIEAVAPDE